MNNEPELKGSGNIRRHVVGATLLIGSLGALAFEQSPANESLRINQAAKVLESDGTPLDVGVRVGAITMAIELGSSALIVAGLNQKGGIMHSALDASRERKHRRDLARLNRRRLKKGLDPVPEFNIDKGRANRLTGSIIAYTAMAMGIGAGIVVLEKRRAADEPSLRRDAVHAVAASGLIAGLSGAAGYLAAGGISFLEGTPAEGPAEIFVDHATNTLTWMMILSPIMAFRIGRWLNDVRHERRKE